MKIGIAKIYYGGGRRYFTLRAACLNEAKARVKAHFRRRNGGYFLDDGDKYPGELIARVARLLERHHRTTTP
jgi:hypothetical protein